MFIITKLKICFIVIFILLGSLSFASAKNKIYNQKINFQDNFEVFSFEKWYIQSLPNRVKIITPGFQSKHAVRFEVKDNDKEPDTGDKRSELSLSSPLLKEGKTYLVEDSFKIPSISLDDEWQIIHQLHDTDFSGSPSLAVFINPGPSIRISSGDSRLEFLPSTPISYNRWYTLRYKIKLSQNLNKGFIEIWLNGKSLKLSNDKLRLYSRTIQAKTSYLKIGIYRSNSYKGKTVIFHDQIKIKEIKR